MSKFCGTPGPWFAEKTGRAIGPMGNDDDQSYGMIIPVAFIDFNPDSKTQDANARLISAAPEMLNALRFVLPWLTECDEEALHLAESAISKATGKDASDIQ